VDVQSSKFKVQSSKCRAIARALLDWFTVHARDLPWRHTSDPYAVWVSEIMLQQTQVATVIPYYERWRRELPDVRSLADAPEARVLKLWEGLGYYSRARNLHKAAQQIVRDHGSAFPREFDAMLALPGVGRYTAGAIASIAFNQPAPILDGNVIRVLCRLFALSDNPRDKTTNALLWHLAEQLVITAADSSFAIRHSSFRLSGCCSALNQSLMELGATVCTPRSPNCAACPLRTRCAARKLGLVESLPNLAPRAATSERLFHTFIVSDGGRWLVGQRAAGSVNAGLWEFPNIEVNGAPCDPAESAARCLGVAEAAPDKFTTLKHAITRYRITQEVFTVKLEGTGAGVPLVRGGRPAREFPDVGVLTNPPALAGGTAAPPRRWLAWEDLHALAFTGAHRKLLRKLEQARTPAPA